MPVLCCRTDKSDRRDSPRLIQGLERERQLSAEKLPFVGRHLGGRSRPFPAARCSAMADRSTRVAVTARREEGMDSAAGSGHSSDDGGEVCRAPARGGAVCAWRGRTRPQPARDPGEGAGSRKQAGTSYRSDGERKARDQLSSSKHHESGPQVSIDRPIVFRSVAQLRKRRFSEKRRTEMRPRGCGL
jgi:hypothetical protein